MNLMTDSPAPIQLKDYLANKDWIAPLSGSSNEYVWLRHENFSYLKYPVFHLTPPSAEELQHVFGKSGARVLTYALASTAEKANAYWYVCRKINRSELKDTIQRNIKKAEKTLSVRWVSFQELMSQGFAAYSEMRSRAGLDDFTETHFREHFASKYNEKTCAVLGAWLNDRLVSYVSLMIFPEFVEIEGPYTLNEALQHRPNELLIFNTLDHFLNQAGIPLVSYGFSSVQDMNKENSLHVFKLKCGFEAEPVLRCFEFSPTWRWILNPVTRLALQWAGKIFPRNRMLRKANGVLNYTR